jgi:hypothetical protein
MAQCLGLGQIMNGAIEVPAGGVRVESGQCRKKGQFQGNPRLVLASPRPSACGVFATVGQGRRESRHGDLTPVL